MFELTLPPRVGAPAEARAQLLMLPLERVEQELAILLVSELVTNCVRHAGLGRRQRIKVRGQVTNETVRIEVIDGGAGLRVGLRPVDGTGGWGLRVVDCVADRWGVARAGGTRVWFELDRAADHANAGPARTEPGVRH
jgi:two-component sensor histidine kinase